MARAFILNKGGVAPITLSAKQQKELAQFAGVGLNSPKKRKKKKSSSKSRSTVSSVKGGKSMARRKRGKKKASRRKKGARRKTVRNAPRKRSRRKRARRKSTRRNPVSANPKKRKKRKKARRKSTRRNPVSANPKKPKRRKKSRRKSTPALPSLMGGRGLRYRRPMSFNSGFLTRPNPLGRVGAAKKAIKKRRMGKKGYKRPYMVGGRYAKIRNPRDLAKSLTSNMKALVSFPVMIDAVQITVGSVGSELLGAGIATFVERVKKDGVPIAMDSPLGYLLKGLAGASLATVASIFMKKATVPQNILYGTIGGIGADFAKRYIVPRLPGMGPMIAAAAPIEAPAEGGAEGAGVSDFLTLPPGMSGLSGPRGRLSREVSQMRDYATTGQIVRAAVAEEF